jgi:hypothetical protein
VRDVAEQHVLEDLGFIPALSDWLKASDVEIVPASGTKRGSD